VGRSWPLDLVEQGVLIVFVLMTLVGIAGGRSDSVIQSLVNTFGQLLVAIVSVLASVAIMLVKLTVGFTASAIGVAFHAARSASQAQSRSIGDANSNRW